MRIACYLLLPLSTVAFLPGLPEKPAVQHLHAVKEATFGMGCFWEPAEELQKVDGVIDTVAGYTGNPSAERSPTYDSVCFGRDWVEGVRVQYDDNKLSYEQLLDAFSMAQKPKLGSRQYSSIIFPHDEEQNSVAQSYLKKHTKNPSTNLVGTTVEPASKFYQAEGYHQNYWQKQRPRFAAIVGLIALATGRLDPILPVTLQETVETGANAGVLAIGLYVAFERFFDAEVVEL